MLFVEKLVALDFTISVDTDSSRAWFSIKDIGAHQHGKLLVPVLHCRQQLVGYYLATLVLLRIRHPPATHLPAATHIVVHLGKKIESLVCQGLWYIQGITLIIKLNNDVHTVHATKMLVKIPDLLSPTQLEAVCSVLRQGRFVDGKHSAGKKASPLKNNQELAASQDDYTALNNVVMTELVRHPAYLQKAMPVKVCAPIYARYTSGMAYGGHIDDPIMGPPDARYRSDISISVFLNEPEEYEGGELCIETPQGEVAIKLPAGHAILYPSTSYHSVREVTAGERLVAICWVQSAIRRADQREILVQLSEARDLLADSADSTAYQKVNLSYVNLFRLWAEI